MYFEVVPVFRTRLPTNIYIYIYSPLNETINISKNTQTDEVKLKNSQAYIRK